MGLWCSSMCYICSAFNDRHQGSQIVDSILAITSSALVLLAMMPVTVFLSQPAMAQGLPSTVRGDIGLKAGTLPPPGIYVVNLIYNYNFDTLRTNEGLIDNVYTGNLDCRTLCFAHLSAHSWWEMD